MREAQKAVQIVKTKERGDDKDYWEGAENEVVGKEKGQEEGRAGQGRGNYLPQLYIFV